MYLHIAQKNTTNNLNSKNPKPKDIAEVMALMCARPRINYIIKAGYIERPSPIECILIYTIKYV